MSLLDPDNPPSEPVAPARARVRPRRQTRRARPEQIDTTIPSPCVAICQVDKADAVCTGCLRTLDEIRDWMVMSAGEKQAVLNRIAALRLSQPGSP